METATKQIYYGGATRKQQEFIESRIRQELGRCQSMLVCSALDKGFFNYEDIQNFYYKHCPNCGGDFERCDCKEEGYISAEEIENIEEEPQEIYEWWPINSSFLIEDLLKMSEAVLSNDYGDWWGRTCTGQSISLDPTFWDVFQEGVKTQ